MFWLVCDIDDKDYDKENGTAKDRDANVNKWRPALGLASVITATVQVLGTRRGFNTTQFSGGLGGGSSHIMKPVDEEFMQAFPRRETN